MKTAAEFITERWPFLASFIDGFTKNTQAYLFGSISKYAEYYHEEKMKETIKEGAKVTYRYDGKPIITPAPFEISNWVKSYEEKLLKLQIDWMAALERISKLENKTKEPEEELRPQAGEIWESRGGRHFEIEEIYQGAQLCLELRGRDINSNEKRYWLLKNNFQFSGNSDFDLIKKISDAPKPVPIPETPLPQPGEIWKNGLGEFNLILLHDQDKTRLVAINEHGYGKPVNSDGKICNKDYSFLNLVEKTDLTFEDFLKLNKGEQ